MLQGNMANINPTHIVETFIGRVTSVVRQMKSASLRKLVVIFPLLQRDAHHIDTWVSLSVACRARRIIFYLCPDVENIDSNEVYSFPLHLFSSDNCVKSLCLRFVSLMLHPGMSNFTNLKKLGLHMVSISGDLQSLLSQCDVLEWLSLTWCSLPHLIICQPLCRLRYLEVHHCSLQKLDLQAPNLTEFELTNSPIPARLGECVNLSVAKIVLLSSSDCFDYVCAELPGALYHVQDTLSINMTIRTEFQGFAEGVAMFNNVKHLILNIDIEGGTNYSSGILRLTWLLKLAPCLEELELNMYCHGPPIYVRQLDSSSFLCPHSHLKTVRMTGFYGIRGQLELALHILRSAKVLERLIIDPKIKVAWGPVMDWSVQRLMTVGRLMARLRLFKGEYGRVVTLL
ncbi:hypothetical protein PR202_ga22259 [Eleusine coracana subsp. coracana]|uniref:At1g61320/AtMIF1 LRR domain-containing protein n=1 Tax=Eleusine coracana subsp. coracana TaxID=191504 RepID=A0AAV5D336_ELECO|nr:hypothetical protein PR202_ga22259 [Eleusine coracana subsp. coracana]